MELNQHSNVKYAITLVIEKHSWRGTCLNTMEILSNAIYVNFQQNIKQRLSIIWKLMDLRISCVNFVTMRHIQACFKISSPERRSWKRFNIGLKIILKFKKDSLLKNHIIQHHTLKKEFKCEQCTYVGASIERLSLVFIYLSPLWLVNFSDQSDSLKTMLKEASRSS